MTEPQTSEAPVSAETADCRLDCIDNAENSFADMTFSCQRPNRCPSFCYAISRIRQELNRSQILISDAQQIFIFLTIPIPLFPVRFIRPGPGREWLPSRELLNVDLVDARQILVDVPSRNVAATRVRFVRRLLLGGFYH